MSSIVTPDGSKEQKSSQNEPLIQSGGETERMRNKQISDETLPFCEALVASSKLAVFVVIGTFFHPIYSITNNIVLGHSDDETPLAGLGLGALTIGITGLSLGICFAFGVGTFMAQEFGRKNFRMLQVYRNRSIFLNTIVYIILLIPTLFIESIYKAIGQEEQVAAYAAQYVHTIMPFLWFEMTNWAFLQFCLSQRVMIVQVVSVGAGALTHGLLVYLLVFVLDLGFTGICWATAMVFIGRSIATQILLRVKADSFTLYDDVRFFSRETTTNLRPLIGLSVKAMFMGIWGWWAFEIFTFMATYLGETEAAAQSQMRSLGLLTFMLPVGYSSASGILSGNAIGEYKPNLAMTYYKVCLVMASIITVIQMSVLWLAEDPMVRMYTSNEEVAKLLHQAWPILIIFTLFDTTQAMGMALIRATGKQGFGAIITGTAYFIVGIPFSYYFAFVKEQDIRGLWWGPTFATLYNTIWYNIIIFRTDWPKLINGIIEREEKEEQIRKELEEQRLKEKGDDDFVMAEDQQQADEPTATAAVANKIN